MPLLKIETVPALDRLRWEDLEFKSSLGYVMRQRKKEGEGKKEERWEGGENRPQVVSTRGFGTLQLLQAASWAASFDSPAGSLPGRQSHGR